MKKIKETVEFNFNDIKVFVKIDYINNRIDVVEPIDTNRSNFTIKKWVFHQRGVEYIKGWVDVLDAIQKSIKEAKLMYEKNLALESKKKDDMVEKVIKLTKKK